MVWKGVIIEESLEDKNILGLVKIIKTTQSTLESEEERGFLHFHYVEIYDDKKDEFIEKAKDAIKNSWYLHICNDGKMIVVYKNQSFEFTKEQKEKIKEAEEYGISIGILKEQVKFDDLINDPWS